VGRILAQIYKDIKPVDTSPAQFGCLDAIDDAEVVDALLDAAETWLKARGADVIVGPFSPSVNAESGLLVEGSTRCRWFSCRGIRPICRVLSRPMVIRRRAI